MTDRTPQEQLVVDTLYRASFELQTEGRELVGLAMPWMKPTSVRDLIAGRAGPPYLEAFHRGSFDKTLAVRPEPRPVFKRHNYTEDPVGISHFYRTEPGLGFRVLLSRTRDADETLELVNDGAMRSVSVGFRPIQASKMRAADGGIVIVRKEVALRELSLAPTGFGQVPEAKILAVRDELFAGEVLDETDEAEAALLRTTEYGELSDEEMHEDEAQQRAAADAAGERAEHPRADAWRRRFALLERP